MTYKLNNKINKIIITCILASMFLFLTTNVSSIIIDTEPPELGKVGHYPVNPVNTDSILFNCSAEDVSGIASVTLYYRINNGGWYNIGMEQVESTPVYEYDFGLFAPNVFVEYYVVAIDASENSNTATDDNGGLYYNFTVGLNDIDGPTIYDVLFLPATPNNVEQITINCTVVDDYSSIEKVTLYYRDNTSQWLTEEFELLIGETYQVVIGPFSPNLLIEFYINATDDSANANFEINDNQGSYYSFYVIPITTEENPIPYIIPIIAVASVIIIYKRRK